MKFQLYYVHVAVVALLSVTLNVIAQDTPVLKLKTDEEGQVLTSDGEPLFLARFSPEGYNIGFSADFRSTKFDISAVAKKTRGYLPLAVQKSPEETRATHVVIVNATHLESFFINKDYIVFPSSFSKIAQSGPFIRLVFYRPKTEDEYETINSWEIKLKQKEKSVQGKLTQSGTFDLSNVTLDPIYCVLKDPSSSQLYENVAFPAIRGAVRGLVLYRVYKLWKM